jgi:hypothetical protein
MNEYFSKEITWHESLLEEYNSFIVEQFNKQDFIEYNEILFPAHNCGIEGNSFSVDETRDLKEQGIGMNRAYEQKKYQGMSL